MFLLKKMPEIKLSFEQAIALLHKEWRDNNRRLTINLGSTTAVTILEMDLFGNFPSVLRGLRSESPKALSNPKNNPSMKILYETGVHRPLHSLTNLVLNRLVYVNDDSFEIGDYRFRNIIVRKLWSYNDF